MSDDFFLDDAEIDAIADEGAEVDAQAADILAEAWPDAVADREPPEDVERVAEQVRAGVSSGAWPYGYFAPDVGDTRGALHDAPGRWLDCAAGTISPHEDPVQERGFSIEEAAAVGGTMHADWLALVLGLVRRGRGAEFSAERALDDLEGMDEIEGELEDPEDSLLHFGAVIEVLGPLWQALGALDEDRRLTELGLWGLPRALHLVWHQPELDREAAAFWDDYTTRSLDFEPLDPETEQAALDIVARGPIDPGQLRRKLASEQMIVDESHLFQSLIAHEEIFEFDDGLWGHVPTLCEGVVLTHRVTAEEIALGSLAPGLDLDPWTMLADNDIELAGSGPLETLYSPQDEIPGGDTFGIRGPDGWLEGVEPGEVIGLRYVAGSIELERLDEGDLGGSTAPEDEAHLVAAARQAAAIADEVGGPDELGVLGSEIVYRTRSEHPGSLTTPRRPLSEVLAETELSIHRGLVGLPGTEWEPSPSWMTDSQKALWRLWRAALRGDRDVDLADLARSMDAQMAEIFAADLLFEDEAENVATAMLAVAEGPAAAVPHYFLAATAETRGDLTDRVDHLERAMSADAAFEPAVIELADTRSLQGDARGAHELYRAAGFMADSPEMSLLRPFLHAPDAVTGRNKPCPCGSGKKYKVCHGRTDRHPLPQRAGWLWHKVELHLTRPLHRLEMIAWAEELVAPDADVQDIVAESRTNPTVMELFAFDGGGIKRFLEEYGDALLAPGGPPEVRTGDGDEMVFCTARYECADLDEVWSQLEVQPDVSVADDAALHVLDERHTILGTFRRDARLVVETTSIERLRRMQDALFDVAPDATLVDESTEPLSLGDLGDDGPAGAGQSGAPAGVDLDPETMEAVLETMRERWYDEPVPALGGPDAA